MRVPTRIFAALALASALSACATTSYGPMTRDGGYSDLRVSDYVYRITVSGNSSTSQQRVQEFALLRASELTLAAGRQRFVILNENVVPTSELVVSGNTSVSNGGWFRDENTTTVNLPEISSITKSGGTVVIEAVSRDDPRFASAYDATLVDSQLRPKLVKDWWDPSRVIE